MGNAIQTEIVQLSPNGASQYILLNDFAKKFLTGTSDVDEKKFEAHIEFSINKKGEHYAAVWLSRKK